MKKPRKVFARVGWGFLDQMLSSVTNFILTVAVARAVDPSAFGLFTTLLAAFTLALAVARGVTSDPLLTTYSARARGEDFTRAAAGSLGTSLVAGVTILVLVSILALIGPLHVPLALVVFGAIAPGILVQDGVRYILFAQGLASRAFINDLAWAILQIGFIAALTATGETSVGALIGAWGVAGLICGGVGCWQCRILPSPALARWWTKAHSSLWRYYALENSLLNGTNLAILAMVGSIVGLSATAGIRASVALFGPLTVVALGARAILVPEFVRMVGAPTFYRRVIMLGVLFALVTGAWGAVCFAIPTTLGTRLFGETWSIARPLMPYIAVDTCGVTYLMATSVGLRALGHARRGFAARAIMSVARVAGAAISAEAAGVKGVVVCFAVLAPLQVVVWTWQFTAACRDHVAGSDTPRVPAHRQGAGRRRR